MPELAPWLPDWKQATILRVPTSPTVTFAIAVDSAGMTEWDDIFCIITIDSAFNLVLQPARRPTGSQAGMGEQRSIAT